VEVWLAYDKQVSRDIVPQANYTP